MGKLENTDVPLKWEDTFAKIHYKLFEYLLIKWNEAFAFEYDRNWIERVAGFEKTLAIQKLLGVEDHNFI